MYSDPRELSQLVWHEEVDCGSGAHPLELSATPWDGVQVLFNPCDLLPGALRDLSGSTCGQHSLRRLRLEELLQEVWRDSSVARPRSLGVPLQLYVLALAARRDELAAALLNTSPLIDALAALASAEPAICWAGLVQQHRRPQARALETLLRLGRQPNRILRAGALSALRLLRDPRAIAALIQGLGDDQISVLLRTDWVLAIQEQSQAEHLPSLWQTLVSPGVRHFRHELATAIASVLRRLTPTHFPQVVDSLATAIAGATVEQRNVLCEAFAAMNGHVLPLLHSLLQGASTPDREFIAEALGNIGDPASRHALLDAYQQFPEVRPELAGALFALLNSPHLVRFDVPYLASLLTIDDPDIRLLAVQGLGKNSDPAAEPVLHQLRGDPSQPETIRQQAATALARRSQRREILGKSKVR